MVKAGRGSDQFQVRLPEGLRDQIKSDAERNERSMNAEMVSRLLESVADRSRLEDLEKQIAELQVEIARKAGVIEGMQTSVDFFHDLLRRTLDEDGVTLRLAVEEFFDKKFNTGRAR